MDSSRETLLRSLVRVGMTRLAFAHALVACVLLLSVLSVRADIPVHCRHGQVRVSFDACVCVCVPWL